MEPRWNYRVRKFLGRLHRMISPPPMVCRLAWASMEPFGGRYVEWNLWPKLPQPNIFRLCAVSQPVATLPNSVEQATSAT
jgi:hypothetical protein